MPYIEILTFDGAIQNRLKLSLSDSIDIDEELMAVPTTSLTLPAEYYEVCANGLKRMRIYFNGNVYDGIIFGVNTNKEDETIEVTLTHLASSWDFRCVPTNKAVKALAIPDIYQDKDFIYDDSWTFEFDDTAKEETIDYVYSRQGKLEAITQTIELTQDLWWRIPLNKSKVFQIGVFGEDSGYFLSTKKASKKGIQIISEPSITEDYSNVINLATVYSDESDGGVTSLSLREVYNDKSLQDEKFPVIIIDNHINNEREYDYANYPKVAPNTQLEYAVMDTESIALESGYLREGSFAFNDLSPFSIEEVTQEQNELTTAWIIPEEQRFLTEDEYLNNCKCIYEYFRGKWSDLAIAAFCGAIYVESSGNPNIWQGLDPNYMPASLEGFGLVQWTPYRRITDWLSNHGYSVQDYGVGECRKIEEEWSSGTTNAEWIPTSEYPCKWQEWSAYTDKDIEWMVWAYLKNYGRGVNSGMDSRMKYANQVYQLIKNDWSKAYETTSTSDTGNADGVWKPKEFKSEWNGKSIDLDGAYGAQCVDLWHEFCNEIGEPYQYMNITGYAKDIASQSFQKMEDTSNPIFGDWVVFGNGGDTPYSHIAMVEQLNGGSITIFGQNQGANYCNTVTISSSSVLKYLHVKDEYWGESQEETTTTDNEPVDKTTATIRDEDRIYAAKTVYNAVIKKLINSRRTYQIEVDTTQLPSDLQVGMKIKFFYSNSIYKLDKCGNYMKKILTLNNDFYITKMTRSLDINGNETGQLTLEKFLRIDREVQKE